MGEPRFRRSKNSTTSPRKKSVFPTLFFDDVPWAKGSSITRMFTHFANPERKFRTRKDTTPISVHNIYSFYESESSESESEEVGEIDIEMLTLEQYLALDHNDTRGGIKRPEIGKNIKF
ncbi:hypothetical protein Tco_0780670 [Tanacetum coccineum]